MYGEKIKEKRQALGMSQEYLAEQLGISRQAVSKWEMNKSQPTMANLRELAKIFQVDLNYFVGDKEESVTPGEEKKESIFWSLLQGAIGFVFFLLYYYAIMQSILNLKPNEMPWVILSIYLAMAVIAFPQAIADLGNKLDNLNYYAFSRLILPLVYIFAPLIVVYYLFKKDSK